VPVGSSVMLGTHVVSETLFYVWRSCVIGNFVLCLEVLCNRKLCFMFGGLVLSETLFSKHKTKFPITQDLQT
jgi:hypothetical protein